MSDIVQTVENALSNAEHATINDVTHAAKTLADLITEAKAKAEAEAAKLVEEAETKVKGFIGKVETDAKDLAQHVGDSRVVTELEALTMKLRHPVTNVIDPAVAAAESAAKHDSEEDAEIVSGVFMRTVRRLWALV